MRMKYGFWVALIWRWFAIAGLLSALSYAQAQSASGIGIAAEPPTERLRPQVRSEPLAATALSALQRQSIEPFLSAPQVFDPGQFNALPRIVGAPVPRSLFSKSDVVYARTPKGNGLVLSPALSREWNIYRNPRALKDPATGEVLGMEAEYLGRARLLSGEHIEQSQKEGKTLETIAPASFEIVHSVAEIRTGDRLFQGNGNAWRELTPHAPEPGIAAIIISIYGSGVANASKNQIVVLNQGSKQGLKPGHLMSIRKTPSLTTDVTDPARPALRPAVGISGQALVFLTFDKLAYALISDITEPVQVGDRLTSP
jgi:hypothetical protein